MTAAERERIWSITIAAVALVAAVPLGIIAATDGRSWLLAGVCGFAVVCAVGHWFRRDPAIVLVALWAFQVIRRPLAAAGHSLPLAGTLVDQLTDLCVLVILLALLWDWARPGGSRRDVRYFWPALALAGCGLAGSFIQGAPLPPTLMGLWSGTRFWLLVGVTAAVPWRRADVDRVLRVMTVFGSAAAVLGLIDAATGGAVADAVNSNVGATQLSSYRSHAAQSLYGRPGEYGLAMSLLVAVWLARVATMKRPRARDIALLGLFVVAAAVSLRLKAVLCVATVFAIVAMAQMLWLRRQALKMLAVGAVILVLLSVFMGDVVQRQLDAYTGAASTPRGQLYAVGVQIARDDFPFGVGFGRFGTAPSSNPYSDVYDEYGLSGTWGLSKAFPRYLTDTSWPAVIGETGVVGLLVYVAGLLALLSTGLRMLRSARGPDAFAPLALIAVVAVVLVDSTGSPTLFSWTTITVVALVAGPTLAQRRTVLAAARRSRRSRRPQHLAGRAVATAVRADRAG